MGSRLSSIAAHTAASHGVISDVELKAFGVDSSLRRKWVRSGRLEALGSHSFALPGAPPTWKRSLAAGLIDLNGAGVVAGRAAAQLHGLDGFRSDACEFVVPRDRRGLSSTSGVVRSTQQALGPGDLTRVDGLAVVRAERLILDAPLFGFTRHDIENAIDSAIRLRLVSEQRLRTRAIEGHRRGVNGSRVLLDALIDTGGESRLERMFLRLVRAAGIDRPSTQRVFANKQRTIARVDFNFPTGLVVEVNGFGFHSNRQQLQRDSQRHTELTVRGHRVITFTYDDVRFRPDWVLQQLRCALTLPLAA